MPAKTAISTISFDFSNPQATRTPDANQAAILILLPLEILYKIGSLLSDEDIAMFAATGAYSFWVFNSFLDRRVELRNLTQLIIDGRFSEVQKTLAQIPELLLQQPADFGVEAVQSQLTWQTFKVDKPLLMAAKRQQVNMLKVMLPFFAGLDKQLRISTLTQWAAHKNQTKSLEYDFTPLIDAVLASQIEGMAVESRELAKAEAEAAIQQFKTTFVPASAIDLDQSIDIEKTLLSAYALLQDGTSFARSIASFFCIQVIGFLLGLVTPERAAKICGNADFSLLNAGVFSVKGLPNRVKFYRESLSSTQGIGSQFWSVAGNPNANFHVAAGPEWAIVGANFSSTWLQRGVKETQQELEQVYTSYTQSI